MSNLRINLAPVVAVKHRVRENLGFSEYRLFLPKRDIDPPNEFNRGEEIVNPRPLVKSKNIRAYTDEQLKRYVDIAGRGATRQFFEALINRSLDETRVRVNGHWHLIHDGSTTEFTSKCVAVNIELTSLEYKITLLQVKEMTLT